MSQATRAGGYQEAEGRVPFATSVSASARAEEDDATSDELNEVTLMLRRLIDEASGSARKLETLLQRASDRDSGTRQASVRLQERLRLGARMLQAFQVQIDHVDAVVRELREQQQLNRVEQADLESQVAVLEERLDELTRSGAVAGGTVSPTAISEPTMRSCEDRVRSLSARAHTIRDTVKSTELDVEALAERCTSAARRAEARIVDLQSLNHQAARARQRLSKTLASMTARSQQIEQRLARVEAVSLRTE